MSGEGVDAVELLRDLQRAVRAFALGLGSPAVGWERILAAERRARGFIEEIDRHERIERMERIEVAAHRVYYGPSKGSVAVRAWAELGAALAGEEEAAP